LDEAQLTLRRWRAFGGGESGAGAAEFALILPALMFLLFGTINLFVVIYAEANLHSATEAAARWASVTIAATGTSTGVTPDTVSAFGKTKYIGPNIGVAFACSQSGGVCVSGGCGYNVTGTGTYKLYYGFGTKNISLAANACFP
jgi:hypothetical protein